MSRIVFIGAGSVVFTRQLVADILHFEDLTGVTLVLHDIDEERLDVARATAEQLVDRWSRPVEVQSTTDRRRALDGADFVVNMVQVGGLDATRIDHELPSRFGLRQTIGDTIGVGGIFRGLRTFPVLSAIARDMASLCPDAWLLNYTNPMAMNVWWLSVVAPQLKVAGLCHSVYWTVRGLCELVGVPIEETHYRAAGVNHQSWLLEWSRDGRDLYPLLREAIQTDPELLRRTRVEIFQRIGFYPTETSEHSAEYLSWFLRSDEQIEKFRLVPSEYLGISERNLAEFAEAKEVLASGGQLAVGSGATEYAPQVIHSMLTGESCLIHANVVNRGLIDNLPQQAVVEVPCLVDAAGLHPQAMGALPAQGAALNRSYLAVAELTVEAARQGDARLVRQAALVDPNTSSTLTPEKIWELCDAMSRAHADVFPRELGGRLSLLA